MPKYNLLYKSTKK